MPYKCDGINCQARHDLVKSFGCPVPTHTSPQCWYVFEGDKNYAAELQLLHHDFIADIEALAERARQEVVIPFCDKHKLWFVSGMGVYSFDKIIGKKGNPDGVTSLDWDQYLDEGFAASDSDDPEDVAWIEQRRPPEGYEAVRAVVGIVIPDTRGEQLGLYMKDYTP